ncbi:MAG: hypothetical protein DMG92_00230, partial [Acidobacteria bacterium]
MLFLKYLLLCGGIGMIAAAVAILARDFYFELKYRQSLATGTTSVSATPEIHWRPSIALALFAWGPILLALSIVVVPSGMGGVRVSQTSGTLPGTLYPGAHFVTPLAESLALFDTRDQLFTTGSIEDGKPEKKRTSNLDPLRVQAKEGLSLGFAITIRYRLDP